MDRDYPTAVKTANLTACKVTTNDFVARDIKARDLDVRDITANDLTVNDITANDLTVNDITANDLAVRDIGARNLTVNDITANDLAVRDIGARNLTVNDVTANDLTVNDVGANDVTAVQYLTVNTLASPPVSYNIADATNAQGNILTWGAIPNAPASAATNDAAFAQALASPDTKIIVPCGVYYVSSTITIPDNKSLIGESQGCPIIASSADVGVQMGFSSKFANFILYYTGSNQANINTVGINMVGTQLSKVTNLRVGIIDGANVSNVWYNGIVLLATLTNSVQNYIEHSIIGGHLRSLYLDGTASISKSNVVNNVEFRVESAATTNVIELLASEANTFTGILLSANTTAVNGINFLSGTRTVVQGLTTVNLSGNQIVEAIPGDNHFSYYDATLVGMVSSSDFFFSAGERVVSNRGTSVAAVPAVGAAYDQAEVNAIVTAVNALIDRLKVTGGHGLIED
jgi:hypothetical protein